MYFFVNEGEQVLVYSVTPNEEAINKCRKRIMADYHLNGNVYSAFSEADNVLFERCKRAVSDMALNTGCHRFACMASTDTEKINALLCDAGSKFMPYRVVKSFPKDEVKMYLMFLDGDVYVNSEIKNIVSVPEELFALNRLLKADNFEELLERLTFKNHILLYDITLKDKIESIEFLKLASYFGAVYKLYPDNIIASLTNQ